MIIFPVHMRKTYNLCRGENLSVKAPTGKYSKDSTKDRTQIYHQVWPSNSFRFKTVNYPRTYKMKPLCWSLWPTQTSSSTSAASSTNKTCRHPFLWRWCLTVYKRNISHSGQATRKYCEFTPSKFYQPSNIFIIMRDELCMATSRLQISCLTGNRWNWLTLETRGS